LLSGISLVGAGGDSYAGVWPVENR
jgi:hypothetical protein